MKKARKSSFLVSMAGKMKTVLMLFLFVIVWILASIGCIDKPVNFQSQGRGLRDNTSFLVDREEPWLSLRQTREESLSWFGTYFLTVSSTWRIFWKLFLSFVTPMKSWQSSTPRSAAPLTTWMLLTSCLIYVFGKICHLSKLKPGCVGHYVISFKY